MSRRRESETIRLATRGSELARRQAAAVREALEDRRTTVELVEVETTGDQVRDELIHELGTTGAFVRSLDERVLAGDVDAAVHSMKDVPTEMPEDLVLAGVPERAPAGDLLVTPDGTDLADLPAGATVGTASLRRRAQIGAERPDLSVANLRGNVDTRLAKLLAPTLQREHERRLLAAGELEPPADEEGDADDDAEDESDGEDRPEFERSPQEWFDDLSELERRALERDVDTEYDAVVLAAAGLERLGLTHHVGTNALPTESFVPSAGQGAVAVTARDGAVADRINERLDHPPTRVATTVERVVLDEVGGGCVAPIGVHAVLQGAHVTAAAQVLSRDGTDVVAERRDLPVERHAAAAREFGADLVDRGADDLVAAARRDEPDAAKRGDGDSGGGEGS
jgi:hydroxymethylbilane synthase